MAAALGSLRTHLMEKGLGPVLGEMIRVFPEGLVITSGLYAALTMSLAFGVFFLALVESLVIYHGIRFFGSFFHVADLTPASASPKCRTGFSVPDLSMLSMFGSESRFPFPSPHIYILSVASAYMFSTLNSQTKELQALGPAYASRYYLSVIMLSLFLLGFTLFRLVNGCESFGVLLLTVPVGILVGTILMQINQRLFGQNAMNLIGIPLLRGRTANGQKLYVCPTTSKK